MSAAGTSIIAIVLPPVQIIAVPSLALSDLQQGFIADGFECNLNYAGW